MTKLLEIKEKLCNIYGKLEIYVKPAIRFVLSLITFLVINGELGYMTQLTNPVIPLGLAVICTFLPIGVTLVLASVMIVLHLFALALEAALIALILLIVIFFMYFKFAPKAGYTAVLSALLSYIHIPEVVPTVIGLVKTPFTVISMVCSTVFFYFLRGVCANASVLAAAEGENEVSKFKIALQGLVGNEEMYILCIASVITTLVVYCIRRLSINHAWKIAIGVGNAANLLVLLIGNVMIKKTENIVWIFVGIVAAMAVGILVEFFRLQLDYTRTEQVQFEDDEYYYYVKAVPKMYVTLEDKKVKRIGKEDDSFSKQQLAEEFDIDEKELDV